VAIKPTKLAKQLYYQYKANSDSCLGEIRILFNRVNEKKKSFPTNFLIDFLFMIVHKYFIKKDIYCIPLIELNNE
jgi:hypothetical protein